MSHGQATGLLAMACWWSASWALTYWVDVWWMPPACLAVSAVGGGVLVFGWMMDQGGVRVEKIK